MSGKSDTLAPLLPLEVIRTRLAVWLFRVRCKQLLLICMIIPPILAIRKLWPWHTSFAMNFNINETCKILVSFSVLTRDNPEDLKQGDPPFESSHQASDIIALRSRRSGDQTYHQLFSRWLANFPKRNPSFCSRNFWYPSGSFANLTLHVSLFWSARSCHGVSPKDARMAVTKQIARIYVSNLENYVKERPSSWSIWTKSVAKNGLTTSFVMLPVQIKIHFTGLNFWFLDRRNASVALR
jgi:hypothetical protein